MRKIINIPVQLKGYSFNCASFKDDNDEAICIYKGDADFFKTENVYVRIHSGCITSEVFGMSNCDCKWQLDKSIEIISSVKSGIIIYLPSHEGKSNGLFNKIRSFKMKNIGLSTPDAYEAIGLPSDNRSYNFAVRILKELGISKIKLITNSPTKVMACVDGGITVTERVPVVIENPNPIVKQLLENKMYQFNHIIN